MRSKGIAAEQPPVTAEGHRKGDARASVLGYARSHDGITTATAVSLLGEKDYTARRLLNTMVEERFLEKAGERKGRVHKTIRHPF